MDLDILEKVAMTRSTNGKVDLLGRLSPLGVRIVSTALDPMLTFGVRVGDTAGTVASCNALTCESVIIDALGIEAELWWERLLSLLVDTLGTRKLTGNAAKDELSRALACAPTALDCMWACRVVNKDLECGVGLTLFERVFPGVVKKFEVSLAEPFDPDRHELRGEWRLEPKLDGLRCTVVCGIPYTRGGRRISGIDDIIGSISFMSGARSVDDVVLDGELIGSVDFDEGSGIVRCHDESRKGSIVYNVFDAVEKGEWDARSTAPFFVRRSKIVADIAPCERVRVVPSVSVIDPKIHELFHFRDSMIASGYEGAMAKDCSAQYCFGRSPAMLKLKRFETGDYAIVDVTEGRGKNAGMLGALWIDVDGRACKVGSGFSDAQRIELWARREDLQGKVVEVQYQNKSSKGALRFPVFVRMRPDKG